MYSRSALKRFALSALVALLPMLSASAASAAELLSLQSRPGVTQSAWLDTPSATPPWVVMLFAGGDGGVGLAADGPLRMKANFVLRTAGYWSSHGDAAVIYDVPSDETGGMPDRFRLSDAAQQDVSAVVAALRQRFPGAKIALVGTSRGTITVGNVLKRSPELADAYVLTSPVTVAMGRQTGLSALDWKGNTARVLVLANEHDGCEVSPFSRAKSLAEDNHFDFIAVSSTADDGKPKGECGASAPHGFLGIDQQVLDEIDQWLNGKPN